MTAKQKWKPLSEPMPIFCAVPQDTWNQITALIETITAENYTTRRFVHRGVWAWRAEIKFKAGCIKRKIDRYPVDLAEFDEPE